MMKTQRLLSRRPPIAARIARVAGATALAGIAAISNSPEAGPAVTHIRGEFPGNGVVQVAPFVSTEYAEPATGAT